MFPFGSMKPINRAPRFVTPRDPYQQQRRPPVPSHWIGRLTSPGLERHSESHENGDDVAFGIPNKSRSRFLAVSGKGQCKENGLYSDGGDLTSVGDACLNSAPGPMPSSALIHDIIDFSAGQSSPGQKPYAERPLDHLTWRHQPRFATQSKRQ